MTDNVSDDGVHLEQSGFYHYYTLRSFIELARTALIWNDPLSTPYYEKLDRMLAFAADIADSDGKLRGLPYTAVDFDIDSGFLGGLDSLPRGPGLDRFFAALQGDQSGRLSVYSQGGYSIWSQTSHDTLRITFHHRILDAPHAHQDAAGISVSADNRPLVIFPSSGFTGDDDWSDYFTGPWAHNTVQVDGKQQVPPARRRPGPLAKFFDSHKVNSGISKIGLGDTFQRFRNRTELDRLPLIDRAQSSGGEIVASDSNDIIAYVTARHRNYEGVEHRRTVARLAGKVMIVWDRLLSDDVESYSQTFHFPSQAVVTLDADSGYVSGLRTNAQFIQLSDSKIRHCKGQATPRRCGWFATDTDGIIPVPAIIYRQKGQYIEFLWIFTTDDRQLQAERLEDQLTVSLGRQIFQVQLDDKMSATMAGSND